MQLFSKKLISKVKYRLVLVAAIIMFGLFAVGCSASFNSYVGSYQQASQTLDEYNNSAHTMAEVEVQAIRDKNFALFKAMFADLKNADIAATIQQAYADNLYFNDTFRSIYSAKELTQYLQEAAHKLTVSRIEFGELATNDQSYFLSWTMYIEFDAAGKSVSAESIGVTQIRFDEWGKIVFHQDFWDNNQGFFAHLPYLGYFINKVRARL